MGKEVVYKALNRFQYINFGPLNYQLNTKWTNIPCLQHALL